MKGVASGWRTGFVCAEWAVLKDSWDMGGGSGSVMAYGGEVRTRMASAISVGGEETADVGVRSATVEVHDGWILVEEAMCRFEVVAMDGGGRHHWTPWELDSGELPSQVCLELESEVLLSVRGDNCGRMGKAKTKIEEEWGDARGGEVERRGVVYGWLVVGRQSVARIDVCFMLSNNVCPVVGVCEGIIWPWWGFGWLGLAFGCELVGVDVKEFEV